MKYITRYQLFLACILAAGWIIAAANPPDRIGWLLENVVVFVFVPIIIAFGMYFRISDFSWTCVAVFLLLHISASHWTYDNVPIGYTIGHLLGTTRNMYDRVVHFSFGLLLAYPIREVFNKVTGAKGFWSYYFPLDIVLALSALYEIFEWITSVFLDGTRAATFLGAQGDFWDTQKDMACAAVGAVVTMAILLLINLHRNGGLKEEMKESLRRQV